MCPASVEPGELTGLDDRTLLITGADGMLGRAFSEALQALNSRVKCVALSHADLDVTDPRAVERCARFGPAFILHCAGLAIADQCELQPDLARAVHVDGTENVIHLARATGARIFYPQSVFIFDGSEIPVTEASIPRPTFVYAALKHEAEQRILDDSDSALVVRMAGFFGGDSRDKNFVGKFVRELCRARAEGITELAAGDRTWQPTYTLDHARNTLLLLARGRTGIYHMGAIGEASFFDVARECIDALGLAERMGLRCIDASHYSRDEPARRPMRMVTACERLMADGLFRQRPWQDALREYLSRPYFDDVRGSPVTT